MGTVTVQDLLDWFEVDSGFTKLLFVQTDLCVMCVFVFYSLSFSSCPLLDILHCLPRAAGVPLESALNVASRMSPCGTLATHIAGLGVKINCSICYDRADDSSIHRGRYDILESHCNTLQHTATHTATHTRVKIINYAQCGSIYGISLTSSSFQRQVLMLLPLPAKLLPG